MSRSLLHHIAMDVWYMCISSKGQTKFSEWKQLHVHLYILCLFTRATLICDLCFNQSCVNNFTMLKGKTHGHTCGDTRNVA